MKWNTTFVTCLIVMGGAIIGGPVYSAVIYVDASAGGANTGMTWQDAFVHLQDALSASAPGDQIWVAEGVYRPDEGSGQTSGSRVATFSIPPDIAIYGAFIGSEASVDARAGSAGATILTGDFAANDDWGDLSTFWENAYHVVSCLGGGGARVLDSLTIRGGNADAGTPDFPSGGGVLVADTATTAVGCLIRDNYAFRGGGVYVRGAAPTDFLRCTLEGNRAVDDGGGLLIFESSPYLLACSITDNHAFNPAPGSSSDGGGVFGDPGAGGRFDSCLVAANGARQGAGFYYIGTGAKIAFCTIAHNVALEEGAGIRAGTVAELSNSILWGNQDQDGTTYASQITANSVLVSCSSIIQGYVSGGGACDDLGLDPDFVSPGTGDYHLGHNSPAVNRAFVTGMAPSIDIDGEPRKRECREDIGADESPFFEDCDTDSQSDSCQIQATPGLDTNGNGVLDACDPQGFPVCLGDGSGPACPCMNPGAPGHGCDNAQGTGGVLLSLLTLDTGSTSATLHGTGFPPASSPTAVGIRGFYLLSAGSGAVFGDGILCIGLPVTRMGAQTAIGGELTMPIGHGAGPGTFLYQLWYRNTPKSYCDAGAAFNLSNGVSIQWP